MIAEAIKRIMTGIAFGGIVTFIALTIVMWTGTETTVFKIWFYMLLSFILGIYFGLSSLIFVENGMSMLKQTIIHYCMSVVFYFIIALVGGWVPFTFLAMLVTTLLFTVVYSISWTAYYLYYKKVEENLNASLNRSREPEEQ